MARSCAGRHDHQARALPGVRNQHEPNVPLVHGVQTVAANYPTFKKRARNNASLARPYIWRLSSLRRVTCPSTGPLL
jgi:hypothetical protein